MITLPRNKKVLFFCPHSDDDVISAGATIYALVKNANKVTCIYVTSSPRGVPGDLPIQEKVKIRKTEGTKACKVVGATPLFLDLDQPTLKVNRANIEVVRKLIEKEKPEIVFLPSKNDAHPTHRKTNKVVERALKFFKTKEKWSYGVWTPLVQPNFIFFFGKGLMQKKIKAIKQHKSQLERLDHVTATVGLNTFWGIAGQELLGGWAGSYKNNKQYGEAFVILKN